MDLNKILTSYLEEDISFAKAAKMVQDNSSGKIWLIGGYIFRNLAHILYKIPTPEKVDIDFIVEKINDKLKIPKDWKVEYNRFGTPRFLGKKFRVDLVAPSTIHSINRRSLPFSIENYLTGVPLTIQSVAYDVKSKQLLGEVGIKAVLEKTVRVNNQEEAKWYSAQLNMSLESYIQGKVNSLGFKVV